MSSISRIFESTPVKGGPQPNKLRLGRLLRVLWGLLLILFVRVMYLIIFEYHRYLPPVSPAGLRRGISNRPRSLFLGRVFSGGLLTHRRRSRRIVDCRFPDVIRERQQILESISMIAAVWHFRQGNMAIHRLWATRCFLMLCSPLLLRLMQGAVMTLDYFSTNPTHKRASHRASGNTQSIALRVCICNIPPRLR